MTKYFKYKERLNPITMRKLDGCVTHHFESIMRYRFFVDRSEWRTAFEFNIACTASS